MRKQIFIVDDSKIIRQLIRTHLENRLKHIVCSEAADGMDAIERAMEVEPDLIVLDLCMPRMNGLEAAAILHDRLPNVPIILYTLHKDVISEKRAQAVGIRAVVSKTDRIDVLLGAVQNYVGLSAAATA